MADPVFPYHLAGFAAGAFATGYSLSSLKRYLTRQVAPKEKTVADTNVLPLVHVGKRKRDSDITPLPPTKRRVADAVITSLSGDGNASSDGLDATRPINSVKATSAGSVEGTAGISPRRAHDVHMRLQHGAKTSFRGLKIKIKCGDSHAAVARRNGKCSVNAVVLRAEDEANEEDCNSDLTMIGDDFEHHNDDADGCNDGNEKGNGSRDHDEEDDNSHDQIDEERDSENHDKDLADRTDKEDESPDHDGDDGDSADDEQKDGRAYEGVIRIHLDLKISISEGRKSNVKIMAQNRQPRLRRGREL